MIQPDTLVHDLILPADALPDEEKLVTALGGDAALEDWLVVDVDHQMPQYETQISPSFPLRRRGERRLLLMYQALGPLRKDPQNEPIVAKDLRTEKDRLLTLVAATNARFGRMSSVGGWADAVIVARSPRDLRAWSLLMWALDPMVDLEGRPRAQPLSQKEVEMKIMTYDKRLEELDDVTVLASAAPAKVERRGDFLVVDVLSDLDGSWDVRKSHELEGRIAAFDKFSNIPGAPQKVEAPKVEAPKAETKPAAAAPAPAPSPEPPPSSPIRAERVSDRIVLRIPEDRFNLDLATALGKRHVDVLHAADPVDRPTRHEIADKGAGFVAPLAFLSEVFIEGKPLTKAQFEAGAEAIGPNARAMEAHLPRFGPVRVIDVGGKRWVTSELALPPDALLGLLA